MLDLEVQGLDAPRLFLDVTVRHSVPGDADRLAAAAAFDGAVAKEAEGDKRSRYPSGQTPWQALPLAQETFGRLGRAALNHLRKLARGRAQALPEDVGVAASSLTVRWGCRLSVALHRANAANLRRALGADPAAQAAGLAAALAS